MIQDCCFLALLKLNVANGSLVVPSRAGRSSALTSRTSNAPWDHIAKNQFRFITCGIFLSTTKRLDVFAFEIVTTMF